MKKLIAGASLMLAGMCLSQAAAAAPNFCAQYENRPTFLQAISSVAKAAQYSMDELCSLSKLADIYVENTVFYDENNQPVPHSWVTLHYAQHSCQYFVRDSDQVITRSNCYNTW